MNQTEYIGIGIFGEGVEGGCYRFTEVFWDIPLRSYSVVPTDLLPEDKLKDCVSSGNTFLIVASLHTGPNICMEGEGMLTIYSLNETTESSPSTDLSEDDEDFSNWFDAQSKRMVDEIKKCPGNVRWTDCLLAKVIAYFDKSTARLRKKWEDAGYPLAGIRCRQVPCISTQRCYEVVFHFNCLGGSGSVCFWLPQVYAVVDVSKWVVIDRGDNQNNVVPEDGYGPIPRALFEDGYGPLLRSLVGDGIGPIPRYSEQSGPGIISLAGCGCVPVPQQPCQVGTLEPSDWCAFLNLMPGPGSTPRFYVTGSVCAPNSGYSIRIAKKGVAETNPPTILLEAEVYAAGTVTGMYSPTKLPSRFDEVPSEANYGWASIHLKNSSQAPFTIPVQQIH